MAILYLPTCLPAYLPTCLPACLPACLRACVLVDQDDSAPSQPPSSSTTSCSSSWRPVPGAALQLFFRQASDALDPSSRISVVSRAQLLEQLQVGGGVGGASGAQMLGQVQVGVEAGLQGEL